MKHTPLCLLAALLSLALVSCKPSSTGSRTLASPTSAQMVDFEKRTGVVFPASAKGTAWQHDVGIDDQILLRIELPAADLPTFLTKSGLDTELTNTSRTTATSTFGKFLPAHPTKFREGQKSLPAGKFLNVLVDEDSPTTVVIYLQWFET